MEKYSLQDIVTQTRRDILRMVEAVQSGHPGGALGATEFMVALYNKIMNYKANPFSLEGRNEDIFILSNGHLSALLYSVLARTGHFPIAELKTFRKINSRLQGHPSTHDNLPGVRIATGSLGQGLSVALGICLAKKMNDDKGIVFTLQGDGELQEGQIWEAALYAGAKGIDNIIATIDANGCQIDGTTDDVCSLGNIKQKFEAFGWSVLQIEQGNDINKVLEGLQTAKSMTGKQKPVCVILRTMMGNGVDFMMHTHKWHGNPPSKEQLEKALSQNPETPLKDY